MPIRHVRAVVGYRVHAAAGLSDDTLCGRQPKATARSAPSWLPADGEAVDCPRCLELYPVPEPEPAPEPQLPVPLPLPLTLPEPPPRIEETPAGLRRFAHMARKYFKFLGA